MSSLTPELAKTLRRGTAWVGVASGLAGIADLVSTLACLWLWVSPTELGVATLATALFPVLDRLAQLGLGLAAVRQPSQTTRTHSSLHLLRTDESSFPIRRYGSSRAPPLPL